MKKLITIFAAILMTASVFAQSPQKMSYQAIIRNSSNSLVTSSAVGMQISILQGSSSGTAVYVETQTPTTNANGLVSLEIGAGTVVSGIFSTIDWANGPYFIKTETDPTGGTNYTITGTTQLLSVPYALHAKTAETVNGTEVGAIISTLTDAPTTYLTIGNYQFRYNSTTTGGFIEVKAISGSDNMMVYTTKKSGSWDLAGSSSTQNHRNSTFVSSVGWTPLISLWDGSAWNDNVTLTTYESLEATVFSMGNGSTVPSPLKVYKLFATIDGYNQVFLKVEYNID